jgi:hypothetical protein
MMAYTRGCIGSAHNHHHVLKWREIVLKRVTLALLAMIVATTVMARADQRPSNYGPLSASEQQFVRSLQATLGRRYAHESDAEAAGFFRYTNEDDSGAISFANRHWTSASLAQPCQLWYGRDGALLGADYCEPYKTGAARPTMFGVNPGRWFEFDEHVHWVGTDPKSGKPTYDNYIMAPDFRKGGGDPENPSAATLVKMGKAKSTSSVQKIFEFPSSWDLVVWVKPNPKGAFAWKNPLVKP